MLSNTKKELSRLESSLHEKMHNNSGGSGNHSEDDKKGDDQDRKDWQYIMPTFSYFKPFNPLSFYLLLLFSLKSGESNYFFSKICFNAYISI